MDFRQLETLVTIVKHNSYTHAAEELFLTQPALSSHIQALEDELGTVLLNRSGKNVTLTEAGKVLYNYAVNILNMREQARYSVARYEGRLEGELAIASSNVPQQHLLPALIKDFSSKYPGITYLIKQFDSKGVVDSISGGDADFGFVGTGVMRQGLESMEIGADKLVLITPNAGEYAEAGCNVLTWEKVKGERFIMREKGSGTRKHFEKALGKKGINARDVKVIAEIENPQTIKQCVRAGLGVSIVSERSVMDEAAQGVLKVFHIEDMDLTRKFFFIHHKSRVLSPLARAFKDFVVEYFKGD
ncbi:MAG: Transcriptional regulator, LysR family [Firmicutes bacterium]|nr:Transcriptional regulator, LysR family [Bacillota bacterium]MDI6705734.1 selenium metabolism-associated LysR family transcriptional regulator [Bacillota bacterium]